MIFVHKKHIRTYGPIIINSPIPLVPAMVAVIGPVEPDPAATTLVSVTFWIALNPDPPLRNVRQGVVTVESPVSLN